MMRPVLGLRNMLNGLVLLEKYILMLEPQHLHIHPIDTKSAQIILFEAI